jgi:protocatechuate 3,4-dioxygenase beta subunit
LTFSRAGFATAERHVVLAADESEIAVDVTLTADRIAGQVVDGEGSPVAGANVRAVWRHLNPPARYPAADRDLPTPVTTDAKGRFVFESRQEGAYTFEVTANGYEPATAEIVNLGTGDLRVVLKKRAAQ